MKPQVFGSYTLLDRLGRGGMGEVFLARQHGHAGLERRVAIKRLSGRIAHSSSALANFADEARIVALMNHANIAQIYDFGEVSGQCYLAMEYIHGRNLHELLSRYRELGWTMPIQYACYTVMRVCEALDYAHNRSDYSGRPLDFVHRDISLGNLML
ncbi:MAG: protein kinase, partial [Myxococcota bacterium]